MCGRYAAGRRPEDLVEEFEVDATSGEGPGADPTAPGGWQADWNVAPTKPAPVVLERSERWLRMLTWGLVPSWAKDRTIGSRLINARAEGLLDKPAFRRAALARRCLVPADGWYEWQKSPTETDAKGRPRKQPFFFGHVDGTVLALAGVYEFWRDDSVHPDDPQGWLTTFAIVTTEALPGLDVIHDRMPLALPRDRWDTWLDGKVTEPDAVRALLLPPPPGMVVAVPVSTRVNAVANNGPELVEPVRVEQRGGVEDPLF